MEKAIDEELAAFRKDGPTAAELERARNGIETRMIQGLERLGGFGGVADRLNEYNHYLGNPGYFAEDVQRYQNGDDRLDPRVRASATEAHRARRRLRNSRQAGSRARMFPLRRTLAKGTKHRRGSGERRCPLARESAPEAGPGARR